MKRYQQDQRIWLLVSIFYTKLCSGNPNGNQSTGISQKSAAMLVKLAVIHPVNSSILSVFS